MRFRASLTRWCAGFVAVSLVADAGIAQAQCPPEGKMRLNDVTIAELGSYAVYSFRGPSELRGGICVQTSTFLPSLPVSVAHDRNGDHFFTGEFAIGVAKLPASSYACETNCLPNLVTHIEFPYNADSPPFTGLSPDRNDPFTFHTFQTHQSAWTVGALATPGAAPTGDQIWVPQAGNFWRFPTATVQVGSMHIPVKAWQNHGRLVSFDTSTGVTTVYNLPGDWNQPLSPLWDEGRGRIWFLESGTDFNRPRIGSFDPDQLDRAAIGGTEDFQDPAKLDAVICRPPQVEATCIKYFDLPPVDLGFEIHSAIASTTGVEAPTSIVQAGDGRIWAAGFFSNNLLSLDPDSGDIDLYPLAVAPSGPTCSRTREEIFGRGPFVMDMSSEGLLYVAEFLSGKIGVIDTRTAPAMPSCKTLDGAGENPCVQEFDVEAAHCALYGQAYGQVTFDMNSIFVDSANDVVWFGGGVSRDGPSSCNTPQPIAAPLAGYLERATGQIRFLSGIDDCVFRRPPNPADIFGERTLALHPAANGTDLLGADYYGARVYLLKKLPGSPG